MQTLTFQPLNPQIFAPYGDIVSPEMGEKITVNDGMATRFRDLANVELNGDNTRTLISIFRSEPFELPIKISMLERHPLGSQLFCPLCARPWAVIVADDDHGKPTNLKAFRLDGKTGINFKPNIWHHTLICFEETSEFITVDRDGDGNNLEEYYLDEPMMLVDSL